MNAQHSCSIEKHAASTASTCRDKGYVPVVDIVETPEAFIVTADLPGVAADQIDVQYEEGELRLHAPVVARHPADRRYLLHEYGVGDYRRSFRIGSDVDPTKIAARFVDGVLTLTLPKVEAVKPRRIAVNAN